MSSKTYTIVVGDWSHDGHCQTDSYTVQADSSLSLEACLAAAEDVLGQRLGKFVADYEDSEIPVEFLGDVVKLAVLYDIDLPVFDSVEVSEAGVVADYPDELTYISSEEYFSIWLTMVNIGAALIGSTERVVQIKTNGTVNIGGYGLF